MATSIPWMATVHVSVLYARIISRTSDYKSKSDNNCSVNIANEVYNYLDEHIKPRCASIFNVREHQSRWLPRWNWLDGEENCSSRCYIPGADERERGKVLRKGRIVISAKRTPSRAILSTSLLLSSWIWCCDRKSQHGVSRGEESSFLRLGSLHTLSAKRIPSRYYVHPLSWWIRLLLTVGIYMKAKSRPSCAWYTRNVMLASVNSDEVPRKLRYMRCL